MSYVATKETSPQAVKRIFHICEYKDSGLYQLDLSSHINKLEEFVDVIVVKSDATVGASAANFSVIVCAVNAIVLPAEIEGVRPKRIFRSRT